MAEKKEYLLVEMMVEMTGMKKVASRVVHLEQK